MMRIRPTLCKILANICGCLGFENRKNQSIEYIYFEALETFPDWFLGYVEDIMRNII